MKYKENLLEQLKPLSCFDAMTIHQIGGRSQMKDKTVDIYISRYLKSKEIVKLKKGMYVTTDFYDKHKGEESYKFYLANVLRKPSYISSWTALQYYNLTTELIKTVTSVSPKTTRTYDTKIGSFVYHSIKKDLFDGFYLQKGTFDFFIATPSKALFDLLYLKTKQLRGVRFDMIDELVDELRIDLKGMEEKERKAFYKTIKKYIS
jgi:predicted transcriptional regulator of viral defense system